MRRPIIAGNWKMNKTAAETEQFIKEYLALTKPGINEIETVICPPFTALATAVSMLKGSGAGIGAQNVHWQKSGAYTGEISAGMLCEMGIEWVIIGHSERRQYFGETDEGVCQKIKTALDCGLKPILCVGESLEQREKGITEDIIGTQLTEAVKGLSSEDAAKLVIAYEPVWAIGTGKTASSDDAQRACCFIRETMRTLFNADAAGNVRIQYGGSVKPDNIGQLISQPDIDGALVGGASLKAADFAAIIANAVQQ